MKKNFNWSTYITLIGVIIVFVIIFTGIIDSIYILPVLGAMCLMYGIFGLIQGRHAEEAPANIMQRSMLQLILGAFIIILGIVEALHLTLSQTFWNGFAVIIVIVILLWLYLRHRK